MAPPSFKQIQGTPERMQAERTSGSLSGIQLNYNISTVGWKGSIKSQILPMADGGRRGHAQREWQRRSAGAGRHLHINFAVRINDTDSL